MSSEPDSGSDALTQKQMPRRQFLAGAGAAGAAVAMGAGSAAAQTSGWTTGRGGINFDNDFVQNPYFAEGDLTRAKHRAKWGLTRDDLVFYEDNNGDKAELPGYVPTEDTANVVTLRADKIDAPGLSVFPRGQQYDASGDGEAETDVTALDAEHYTTSSATNGSITVADADSDVSPALRVSTSGLADGETVTATFSDVNIQSDAAKRIFAGIASLPQLDANVTVEFVARDDDGDEKVQKAVAGGDTSTTGVFAASTGNGFVFGDRNADLPTAGSGDGNFDSITEFEIRVSASGGAGDAEVVLTGLDIERKSLWSFGSYVENEGSDDEKTVERTHPSGEFTVTSLDTLGSTFTADDVVFYDVRQPMRYTLAASSEPFEFRFVEATQYQGYDWKFQIRGKQRVPQAIDITHTALEWLDVVDVPTNRFVEVWTANGVDSTDFGDIADSSKTTHTGAYDAEGAQVTLQSSASAGVTNGYGATVLVVDDEKTAIEDTSGGGGGGAAPASGGGMDGILGVLGGGVTALVALFASIKKGLI